jgi:hypothetical protein
MNSIPHIAPFDGMPILSRVSLDIESNDLGLVHQSRSKIRTVSIQCDSEIQLKQEFRRFLDDLYCAGLAEVGTMHASQNTDLSLRSLLIRIGSCHIVIDTLWKSLSQVPALSSHFYRYLSLLKKAYKIAISDINDTGIHLTKK